MLYSEFNENGYPVFGLNGVTTEGICECMNPDCEALYKHPRISSWQNTPVWSEEQIETMEQLGHFSTGYGVLCKGLLVIDVDARNGGIESYSRLVENFPEILDCGFIVETGSGGGSKHLYFKLEDGVKLSGSHKNYKGIDFKSSGYLVGAGSMHKSGKRYKAVYGSIDDIEEAPASILKLLEQTHKVIHTSTYNDQDIELDDSDILEMLSYIDGANMNHDEWLQVGMAIHHATNGSGLDLWTEWSKKSPKSTGKSWERKWNSFGKSASVVTVGTLIYLAQENGYTLKENFDFEVDDEDVKKFEVMLKTKPSNNIDLLNPPKLVGRIARWINSRSLYPRENIAVAAAFLAVSACGGMRFKDKSNITGNLFAFCVAGSGTGKESILQSYTTILREVGISDAVHGSIKSEQELFRNIIDHQASFYTVDEIGEMLSKIQGARNKSGSSSYLEGIIGILMSIYSKASGIQLITGDAKKTLKTSLINELKALEIKVKENEGNSKIEIRIKQLRNSIQDASSGIINPFVNLLGFTAPGKFSTLLDQDMAENGFFARALIFREMDDNPYHKKDFTPPKNPSDDKELQSIVAILNNMYYRGYTQESDRVELIGNQEVIPLSKRAEDLMEMIRHDFWEMGEAQKESDGFVAYTRRGAEMVSRLSLILSMGENEIDEECVLWSYELVKNDLKSKILLTNSNNTHSKEDALISKILSHIPKDGVTIGVLKNKCRPVKSEHIDKGVHHLEIIKRIEKKEVKSLNGRKSIRYYIV